MERFLFPSTHDYRSDRDALKDIANTTMKAINRGGYTIHDANYSLHPHAAVQGTRFFDHNSSSLSNWQSSPNDLLRNKHLQQTYVSILEISTLRCARLLTNTLRLQPTDSGKVGILNFASATKPGGGFRNGAQAQEESIARSSTLYPTLVSHVAREFYHIHNDAPTNAFYTHSIIYSPHVEVVRDDNGGWTKPLSIDVLTCAAVNAGEVRRSRNNIPAGQSTEECITSVMKERMARILYLFEKMGVRNLVLGSFGTGVFRNDVDVIARIWADLLSGPSARFGKSFDRVMFAITGRKTFVEFEESFNGRTRRPSRSPSDPQTTSFPESGPSRRSPL